MDNFKKLEVTTKHHMEIKYVTLYYLCGITMAQRNYLRKKQKERTENYILPLETENFEKTLN